MSTLEIEQAEGQASLHLECNPITPLGIAITNTDGTPKKFEAIPLSVSDTYPPPSNPSKNSVESYFNFGILSTELLPPLVKVSNWGESTLTVDTIVFIDGPIVNTKKLENFIIYYQGTTCEAGTPQLTIYISYNFEGVAGTPITPSNPTGTPPVLANPYSHSYVPYSIPSLNFTITEIENIALIKNVKTFLWNDDPETSRGTVTTVQPS